MSQSGQNWPRRSLTSLDLDPVPPVDTSRATPPRTEAIDLHQTLATLSYAEMIALAGMYERWALTEEKISPDQRTRLIVWSSDYEMIASYAGEGWQPTDPDPDTLMPFVASLELKP